MKDYFAERKELLCRHIWDTCRGEASVLEHINPMAVKVLEQLAEFTCRGKMIRGSLVSVGAGLVDGSVCDASLPLGAAMELLQSALLIHDDIMDRDTVRRGKKTLHTLFSEDAARDGILDAAHLGESLGICLGDISFFLAFDLVGEAGRLSGKDRDVNHLCSKEMSVVGSAQMLDVSWGSCWGDPGISDVLNLYRYKTGRYTFSLPLSAGALVAGANEEMRRCLERFGELVGIIFQIRDDELGLFASEDVLGKPVGSDIAEGKRTIFYLELFAAADEGQKRELGQLFGRGSAGPDEVKRVRQLCGQLGVRTKIDDRLDTLHREAEGELELLQKEFKGDTRFLSYLRQLLDYVASRSF